MSGAGERRRETERAGGGRATPRTVEEALARARDHARTAVAEAVLAARCVLDAASLGATGVPAEGHEALRRTAHWLDRAADAASGGANAEAARWLATVTEALDAEVARWEARSRVDPDARAVLRAFLSVRELLWEFGLRRGSHEAKPDRAPGAPARPRAAAPARRPQRRGGATRLERVPIDGEDAVEPAGRPG